MILFVPKKRNEKKYMQFLDLKRELKKFLIFSTLDIKKIDPEFHNQRLSEWREKGYIKKITKEYYVFSDTEINESLLFLIANKIYSPSYISFEMAFSYYGLIPEAVYAITSASPRKTNHFKTNLADFIYQSIKPKLIFGYKLVEYQGHYFKIAEIEKALLDHFYINSQLKTENDFMGMRFNLEVLRNRVDVSKLKEYLRRFDNKSLEKRINKLLEHIYNA
jgi:predicted transcriptional regulator of viral defense system